MKIYKKKKICDDDDDVYIGFLLINADNNGISRLLNGEFNSLLKIIMKNKAKKEKFKNCVVLCHIYI